MSGQDTIQKYLQLASVMLDEARRAADEGRWDAVETFTRGLLGDAAIAALATQLARELDSATVARTAIASYNLLDELAAGIIRGELQQVLDSTPLWYREGGDEGDGDDSFVLA